MAVHDRFNILSRAVRIANSARLSYPARVKALLDFLVEYFPFSSASLYILDREQRNLSVRITSGQHRITSPCHIPIGEGVAGRCAAVRSVVVMNGDERHPDEYVQHEAEQITAVPVHLEDDLCGVLDTVPATSPSVEPDLDLLEDILTEVAGLIRRIRISEDSHNRIRNLTILHQLGQMLNRSLSPSSLIPLILQNCYDHTETCAIILRLMPESGIPAGMYKKCSRRMTRLLPSLLEVEQSCSDRVLTHAIPLLICDVIADVDLPPSYICVPLIFEGSMLGTLTFFGKGSGGVFSNYVEEDRELFESMAMLISNALAGAVNYQQMMTLSAENDKKLKEGFLLYRISNTMLSTIRLNKLIHLILTALTSGSSPFFDRAMLFLINQRSGVMQGMLGVTRETAQGLINPVAELEDIQASRWDISEEDMARQRDSRFSTQVRARRLELNRSLNVASRAVLDKKTIFVSDTGKEKRVDRDFVKEFGISSFAVAPLMAKEQVVGVVVVDNGQSGKPISRDDLRFLQLFTNQAGMAIENSMLYNRIEDTNRNLREAQERLIQGSDWQQFGAKWLPVLLTN